MVFDMAALLEILKGLSLYDRWNNYGIIERCWGIFHRVSVVFQEGMENTVNVGVRGCD
jgi:hypothetical protein